MDEHGPYENFADVFQATTVDGCEILHHLGRNPRNHGKAHLLTGAGFRPQLCSITRGTEIQTCQHGSGCQAFDSYPNYKADMIINNDGD